MGSDASIFIFDYNRYITEVVPSFRNLLLTGEFDLSLQEVMNDWKQFYTERYGRDYNKPIHIQHLRNTDLARNCTYLTSDLSFIAGWVDIGRDDACFADWDKRACRSSTCPDRAQCPFHINMPQALIEELHYVLAKFITRRCLENELFVGRTYRASKYNKLLKRFKIGMDDRGRQLLDYLGTRGLVIGYQWAGYGEGIHGWLDPEETQKLCDFLSRLPLPQYEATVESLQMFEQEAQTGRVAAELSWEEISLSFVRTIAAIAVKEQKGILWGNDIVVW